MFLTWFLHWGEDNYVTVDITLDHLSIFCLGRVITLILWIPLCTSLPTFPLSLKVKGMFSSHFTLNFCKFLFHSPQFLPRMSNSDGLNTRNAQFSLSERVAYVHCILTTSASSTISSQEAEFATSAVRLVIKTLFNFSNLCLGHQAKQLNPSGC